MKSAAAQRRKLRREKQNIAAIARQVRGQAQLDSMLMRYDDAKRRVIFKAMRPHLNFSAIYPTEENTRIIDRESFAKLREENMS